MTTTTKPRKKQNVRVALTLTPELNEPIQKLAKLTNQPKTAVITDFLMDFIPQLNFVIEAIEHAKAGNKELMAEAVERTLLKANVVLTQAELELHEIKTRK